MKTLTGPAWLVCPTLNQSLWPGEYGTMMGQHETDWHLGVEGRIPRPWSGEE